MPVIPRPKDAPPPFGDKAMIIFGKLRPRAKDQNAVVKPASDRKFDR